VYAPVPADRVDHQRVIGWLVRQDISASTLKLEGVEKMVAQVQSMKPSVVNVGSVSYGVSRDLQRKTESQLFDLAFEDLHARLANVARVMGRAAADMTIDEVNLSGEDTANRQYAMDRRAVPMMAKAATDVEEPTFEPGTTRQSLSFTAKANIRSAVSASGQAPPVESRR
jgi:predicted secreted protein